MKKKRRISLEVEEAVIKQNGINLHLTSTCFAESKFLSFCHTVLLIGLVFVRSSYKTDTALN